MTPGLSSKHASLSVGQPQEISQTSAGRSIFMIVQLLHFWGLVHNFYSRAGTKRQIKSAESQKIIVPTFLGTHLKLGRGPLSLGKGPHEFREGGPHEVRLGEFMLS